MKARNCLFAIGTLSGALALTLLVTGCASARSRSTTRVVEEKQYIQLHHVQDTAQPLDLKKGDAVAMVCSKCKTVWQHGVTSPLLSFPYRYWGRPGDPGYWAWEQQRRAFEDWSRRHYCPGCKSTVTITGTWLNRKETVKHTCEACGDDSVFCCATRKQAAVTKGMER